MQNKIKSNIIINIEWLKKKYFNKFILSKIQNL